MDSQNDTAKITLPETGQDKSQLLQEMQAHADGDANWRDGKTWSLVYHLGKEHDDFIKSAYMTFFSENFLNPMAFKSLKRFETEVVRMTADLLQGDDSVVGTMTAGGTESILMAIKTYRDRARAMKKGGKRPNMIVPHSIHVAFDKAAKYFDVEIIKAPLGPDYAVDVAAVKKLINRNTILLVGSAPAYPQGVIDPIRELGELAMANDLPLHVDSCVGGFMLPFLRALGRDITDFDFSVPGVTSISADVHKYGYAAKGASVILYRDMSYLRHQFFICHDFPGGIFASPAMLGTRPGGAVAAAWAAMMSIGFEGYKHIAQETIAITDKLREGIDAIDGLEVLGNPAMSVFSYHSTDAKVNIHAVGDQMEAKGWHDDRQQKPDSLHAMVTPNHAQAMEQYLSDLEDAVETVRAQPDLAYEGGAAMYGMVTRMPLKGMIEANVLAMMEQMYSGDGKVPELSAGGDGDEKPDMAMRVGTGLLKFVDKLKGKRG
jgi:glutamate/tyrosine decarboxylase-like PLP-dependent enzyme